MVESKVESLSLRPPRWGYFVFVVSGPAALAFAAWPAYPTASVASIALGTVLVIVTWFTPPVCRAELTLESCQIWNHKKVVFEATWNSIDRIEKGLKSKDEGMITEIFAGEESADISYIFGKKFQEFALRRNPNIVIVNGWGGQENP